MIRETRSVSYVGITGFTAPEQVSQVLASYTGSRKLMIGVLASLKTLINQPRNKRYPTLGDIAGIFQDHPSALNLIHYNTQEPESLAGQLTVLMHWAGPHCHGVQLNVVWPPPQEIWNFRQRYPEACIVLQCGREALRRVREESGQLTDLLMRYWFAGWPLDALLFYPSGGKGIPLVVKKMYTLLSALTRGNYVDLTGNADEKIQLGAGVAGGLSATTLGQLEPLLSIFPALSFDAEGRLHDEQDELDLDACRAYLTAATDLLQSVSAR